ncbi:class I SAM-dependent methyltransferase [Sphingobium mellinum]|uniref:class I SAM-dependent methyltransferase n=1 Tax=Sphingobium mellinum TaxID=1387166 RepID=UPI0030EB38AB
MAGTANTHDEHFKPIPLRFGSSFSSRLAFKLRCFVDLQLGTIWRFLGPKLSTLQGNLLDVGCGEMPYRTFLPADVDYVGIDVPQAGAFNMSGNDEVIPFDGNSIPFSDATFDTVLCTEVLEHSPEPALLIAEIERVLKPGGKLIATVPFSARVHYAPYDYHRFSKYALAGMFRTFTDVHISERGNDIAVISNKLIVLAIRMLRPSRSMLLRVPLILLLLPVCVTFLFVAHITLIPTTSDADSRGGFPRR